MKSLRKLELINWHYFSYQEINFDTINFLTGKNASGKTTIIDALQLVILGDTTGKYFNKSATDKSNRSLKGYLRGEFGEDDAGKPVYVRNGAFTTYVVCEFYDDVKNEAFSLGIVVDSFSDESYDARFFYLNGAIPENKFVENNIPLNQKDLRTYLAGKYTDIHFFETNSSYREFCKVLFGNVNNSFFSLFKKAIPFSPITNIEQFITEYVCDVRENIDITSMQENIRDYKRLELEAQAMEKRISKLQQINDKYYSWKSDADQVATQRYIIARGELYLANRFLERLDDNVKDTTNEIEDKKRILANCETQIKRLKQERDNLIQEKFSSDIYQQKAIYEKKLQDTNAEITRLESQVNELKEAMASYIYSWKTAASGLLTHESSLTPTIVEKTKELIVSLNDINNDKNLNIKLLNKFQNTISSYLTMLSSEGFSIRSNKFRLEKEHNILNKEIETLKGGKKAYSANLLEFKAVIERDLERKYGSHIEVNFLADLMDIKNENWRMAIETYLMSQRFYLIVDPKYVQDAIESYESNKQHYHFAEFGILDTEKINNTNSEVKPGSIVEEIETDNEYVKKYIANLMGSLIKCNDVSTLRNNNRSITASGMLYQGYVARQLNFAKNTPFIGRNLAASQLEFKKLQLQRMEDEYIGLNSITKLLDDMQHLEVFNTNEIKNAELVLNSSSVLPSLYEKKNECLSVMSNYTDNYLESIEKNIAKCEEEVTALENERTTLIGDIGECTRDLKTLNDEKVPQAKETLEKAKEFIKSQFDRDWITSNGEPAFIEASTLNRDLPSYLQSVKQGVSSISSRISSKWNSLVEFRIRYNSEYNVDVDANSRDNEYYDHQYSDLSNTKLVEYQTKISEAKQNAMNQFKNDFLSKLKSNFDTVIAQIENLNDALETSKFGDDSYHFDVAPRPEYKKYYEMINDPLLLSGQDITSTLFQTKYGDVIEELFRQITFVDTELEKDVRVELEKNITKFTDYRSYLMFDLIVTNKFGNKISLSRNLLKKSGGETQTPFYISVLASFAQAYHVKLANTNSKFNSIRLIIFDEAFSKMDAERIAMSVKLLREFGLQALLSAPPEKMADISNLVDKTICVVRNNTMSFAKEFKDLKDMD